MLLQVFAPLANPDHFLALALNLFLLTVTLIAFIGPQRLRLDALEAVAAGPRLDDLRARFDRLEVAAANNVTRLDDRLKELEALHTAHRLLALEELSYFDPLTGLRSGALFRAELAALVRPDRPLTCLYIDLDDFGQINEGGHGRGDAALHLAALALRQAVPRSSDRLYRLHRAGDEFAALVEVDEENGGLLADRLLEALAVRGMSATIGLACSLRFASRELEGAADRACQAQKKAGKGRWRIAIEPPIDWAEHLSRVQLIGTEGTVGPHLAQRTIEAGSSSDPSDQQVRQ
jgi:diguanylate cyclase (GGDEF)-like protein